MYANIYICIWWTHILLHYPRTISCIQPKPTHYIYTHTHTGPVWRHTFANCNCNLYTGFDPTPSTVFCWLYQNFRTDTKLCASIDTKFVYIWECYEGGKRTIRGITMEDDSGQMLSCAALPYQSFGLMFCRMGNTFLLFIFLWILLILCRTRCSC